MLERECRLYAFNLRYCRLLVGNVPDNEFADQPIVGVCHPTWILGQLSVASDFAVTLLGGSPGCPPSWQQLFWPGSSVQSDRRVYPTKDELLAGFESVYRRTIEAAQGVTPEILAQP